MKRKINSIDKYKDDYKLEQLIKECVDRCLKKYLSEQINNGVVVYRGMDKNHNTFRNVWVTDSLEYAEYWAQQEYNETAVVNKYFLPNKVIQYLCNQDTFEEIMCEYDAWQDIPDDSTLWDNGYDDCEYDLMHDLCFPSNRQISILKKEGYKGLLFRYDDSCYSILIFNGRELNSI